MMMRKSLVGLCALLALAAGPFGGRLVSGRVADTVFSGTVAGSDQGFLTGASVSIDAGERRETRTDADGRFTFANVKPGRYRLQVAAEGYLPLDQPLDVGDASVSVDIVLLRLPGL